MCGFVGFLNSRECENNRKQKLERARDRIGHRGPDSSGVFWDESISLGHVRLSIIDLSDNASQPMVSANERYVLAYNGEVYNFREMSKRLENEGLALRSSGDTEVVLEYLCAFGIDSCLAAMEGMFAFVLWDRASRILTLARDKFGIKPCYYAVKSTGEVAFASEMKALLDYSRGPDFSSVNAAMLGLGCAYDENTLLRGIKSVCSGEYLQFKLGATEPRSTRYFHLTEFVDEGTYRRNELLCGREALGKVRASLTESMRLCMISDAPLAVLASGGVDSSLLSALARKDVQDLKLFHANVVGASETTAAEALAKHIGCEIYSAVVTPTDTLKNTAIVTYHYEMPLMYHSNAVPFFLVSKLARENGVKVVLTGEGADELFIGYPDMVLWPIVLRFRAITMSIRRLANVIPGFGRLFFPIAEESLASQLRSTVFRYELEERREEARKVYAFIRKRKDHIRSFMSLDMVEGNIPPLLHRNDRLGMAWGIESRFPFLTSLVAGLALNLPPKFKVRGINRPNNWKHPFLADKWCIRKVAEQYLPRNLAFRSKFAFRAVAYRNLRIDRAYFDGGFVEEFYGLSTERLGVMLERASSEWLARMFLLEVWGRLFCRLESPERTRELIQNYVSLG